MHLSPGLHPRPQLTRAHALLLDRIVDFAWDDDDRGLAERWQFGGGPFDRRIQLPFAPESPASGIGETGFHPIAWYRIPLTADDLAEAGRHAQGDRILLHFGAVDHACDVWVDGIHVGAHAGGQTAFAFDVTDALSGDGDHVVVVRAFDDPHDVEVPRGKQDWLEQPHAIWYHRTTGIWRTVWIEAVPAAHIRSIRWMTSPAEAKVHAELRLSHRPSERTHVTVTLEHEGSTLAETSVLAVGDRVEVELVVDAQRNGQAYDALLWSPENPVLLDARLSLVVGGVVVDRADSYLGYRSVMADRGRFLLNDRPCVVRSVLEQGYWPTSHYTPPSTEAMREEVALIKSLGFNAARIHQKTEDPRFLYWCDRLGLMVWGETAGAYEFSARAVGLLTSEWVSIVEQYASHPSIVTWVPLNESWGVQHISHHGMQRSYSRALAALTRALDSTRPVISDDGWEHTDSDVLTIHDYDANGDALSARYASYDALAEQVRGIGPFGRRILADSRVLPDVPVMVTEFGGINFIAEGHRSDGWGYSTARDAADFERRLDEVISAVRDSPVLSGFCYTQLTDTAQETNGLCDEMRVPKLAPEVIRRIVRGAGL
jgi:hypothetical protein